MGFLDVIGLTAKITRPRLRAFLKKYANTGRVLDVGCGAAGYRDLFPQTTTLDIAPREGTKVDIVADAHDLSQIPDASFDVVLCTEVLEHLHTPERAIAEFRRVLKPQGLLLLSTRFIFPLHDVPGDYYRYTKYGLRHLLKDFEIIELAEEASTVETLAVLEQRIGFQCDTLGFRPFKLFWFLLAGLTRWCGWLITREYGDIRKQVPEKNILTSGYYVAAKKI
ncbi:MAG: class I SAM-dependent methyltransferase [Candidatus Peribacteraceae bacterium]|nr:class I SAM-dependent methyltransferase [Candidatus Peribacteraceae bacterium]MDD5741928.1 class I SAM-dependent methyltransferase [Candidatus Peribacteraceae bacterium]